MSNDQMNTLAGAYRFSCPEQTLNGQSFGRAGVTSEHLAAPFPYARAKHWRQQNIYSSMQTLQATDLRNAELN